MADEESRTNEPPAEEPAAETSPDVHEDAGAAGAPERLEEEAGAVPGTPDESGPGALREAEEAIESVETAARAVEEAAGAAIGTTESGAVNLPDFTPTGNGVDVVPAKMNLLRDVALGVKIELGRTQMYVEDVLRLNTDSVIELDKAAGDPVDIYVNDRHVARGEVLVLNENFCVRVSEIIHQDGDGEDSATSDSED